MSGNQLSLTNIIDISVAAAQAGVGDYNTSNLAVFSSEPYDSISFGSAGYKIYLAPTDCGTDFGTDSQTFAQVNAIFSQRPNILAGGGYVVVIPILPEVQALAFSGVAASGVFVINYGGNNSGNINWNDSASQIQVKVRTILGLENAVISGSIASQTLSLSFNGVYGDVALVTISGDTLQTGGAVAITVTPSQTSAGEVLSAAITRTASLIQYFGVIGVRIFSQADMLAAAAVIQALNKLAFFVSRTAADVDPGGMLDLLRSGGFTQSRGLFYGGLSDSSALIMLASYASRGLSTNFSGSNTTSTMHLKDLIGVQPDPSMTQTLKVACDTAGVDIYASLQGVAKVLCSGKNKFFDQIYNLQWLVGALQVALFNFLAQSNTKVPQTESGMDGLKKAARDVFEQAVTNGYSAPGEWNASTTFGILADFVANIQQRGYYIFSNPIAKQSQTARAARQAPLMQTALKEAGAIHSASVIININA